MKKENNYAGGLSNYIVLKEENVPFEDSIERLVLEELTNTENGYGYDFNDDVE